MHIEFTLKDRNGAELHDGDPVNWCCENVTEKPSLFGIVNAMWNDGQVIPGKILFFKSKEQVVNEYRKTEAYKLSPHGSYCPSNSASVELMFFSDTGSPIWSIDCPSEKDDYRHKSLERRSLCI